MENSSIKFEINYMCKSLLCIKTLAWKNCDDLMSACFFFFVFLSHA
jgi:hypothetical protein